MSPGRVQGYKFRAGKPPVGAFIIASGLSIVVFSKPFFVHRWAMRVCFGWRWEDAKL